MYHIIIRPTTHHWITLRSIYACKLNIATTHVCILNHYESKLNIVNNPNLTIFSPDMQKTTHSKHQLFHLIQPNCQLCLLSGLFPPFPPVNITSATTTVLFRSFCELLIVHPRERLQHGPEAVDFRPEGQLWVNGPRNSA